MKGSKAVGAGLLVMGAASLLRAAGAPDLEMIRRIRDEGMKHSRVMETARIMTDRFGPRLSNSPSFLRACRWAVDRFAEFGTRAEVQAYGRVGPGWECEFTSAHMREPRYMPFIAYSRPGSRGTAGKLVGEAVLIDPGGLRDEKDLSEFRGRLAGRIVCLGQERRLTPSFTPAASRLSEDDLADMADPRPAGAIPGRAPGVEGTSAPSPPALPETVLRAFLEREGVGALMVPGGPQGSAPMDKGLVVVGASQPPGGPEGKRPLPEVVVSAEQYNRVARLLHEGVRVVLEVESRVRWEEGDWNDVNVVAELPGRDLAEEIVMIGAHYDSAPAGTGATDNAAGSAAVIEAMRILAAVGARPRRTIRAALWGGEELGRLGSKAYVARHFGGPGPETRLPEHGRLSAYYNMDWYGRFRGIYLQGNEAAGPIFRAWMEPFRDIGMTCLSPGNTGGTDHMSFVDAGLPGFQFIQDDLEFFTTTYHTNMDVYDRLVPADLAQASVVLAAFAYNTAMREERIPRTPDQMRNDRRWFK